MTVRFAESWKKREAARRLMNRSLKRRECDRFVEQHESPAVSSESDPPAGISGPDHKPVFAAPLKNKGSALRGASSTTCRNDEGTREGHRPKTAMS